VDEKRQRKMFRIHLMLTSAIATGAFALLVGASLFLPLAAQLDRPDLNAGDAGGIAEHFLYLHRSFWPVVAGALIASIVSGMLLYQRMTGPLVRFVEVFRQIARGEVPERLTLRRVDYLGLESEELNGMIEGLAVRAAERESRAERGAELLEELEGQGLDERGRDAVSELGDVLKALR